jgi:uncharacterized membrane protein YraQ (UPF0718 family)
MAIAQPVGTRVPWHTLAWGAGMLVALLVATIVVLTGIPGLQNFLLIFNSLMIEAAPFVLLGALVSAAIEVFVPNTAFERLTRLPGPLQLPAAGLAGLAFPVCECGSVPVARRLAAKGLSPAAAVTFMLAAPILNPIVLISTVIAYRGRDVMGPLVLGRAGLGLVAAMAVGWVIGGRVPTSILKPRPEDDHDHGEEGTRWARFFGHLAGDFSFMARFLVLGAAVAAAMQTFVPQSVLGGIADTPIVNLVAMMGLAFVLSLCSESDAFVAASFVQFGPASQLAFLVFGPMVDTKLGFLYSATFTRGFFRTVVVIVGAVTLVGTLWFEVALG